MVEAWFIVQSGYSPQCVNCYLNLKSELFGKFLGEHVSGNLHSPMTKQLRRIAHCNKGSGMLQKMNSNKISRNSLCKCQLIIHHP